MSAPGFSYFDSSQSGAPVLTGAAGKMIAVLDWVLVTGGGWAKAYTGTNLAVYRSASGNRFYLRVDDTQTTLTRLRAYQAMTAVSTGTQPFPNTTQGSASTWGTMKATTAGTGVRRYWGIRTNRYIVMYVEHCNAAVEGYNTIRQMFAFGDVPSLCEADAFNTVLVAGDVSTYQFKMPYNQVFTAVMSPITALSNISVLGAISASPSGSIASPTAAPVAPWAPYSATDRATSVSWVQPGRVSFAPYTLWCHNSATATGGIYPRCRLPNVQHMMGGVDAVAGLSGSLAVDLDTFVVGSRYLTAFAGILINGDTANSYEASLLETSDTDGAL